MDGHIADITTERGLPSAASVRSSYRLRLLEGLEANELGLAQSRGGGSESYRIGWWVLCGLLQGDQPTATLPEATNQN